MRSLLCVTAAAILFAYPMLAQAPAGNAGAAGRGPRNLKILAPENFRSSMDVFTQALGVQCTYCHVQAAFDSDDKPQKNTARMMLTMTREINERFGDGKLHVRCYTCHRASAQPLTEPAGRTEPPAR